MKRSILKIWIVIIILIATFVALTYWGAKSYQESAQSIESLVRPDNKSSITNAIFQAVVQSDLHLNNFILTNKSTQRELAKQYSLEADSLISELELLVEEEPLQQPQIDSLKKIILEKSRIYSILIDVKKRQHSQFFTEQALNKIKTQLSDSAFIDKAVSQKEDLIIKRDTIEQVDVVKIPDNYKGFSGFFRKIFGKEKVIFDTVTSQQEQLNYSLEISENSKIVRDYFIDTTLLAVKDILIEVLDEEIQLQRKLYATEMNIINYNELLLQNIRGLLNDIASSNASSLKDEQQQAILQIDAANKTAFLIGCVGILLGFILLIFLIKDITQTNIYRRRLEEEKERAEQLAIAKETFLSRMSHEIRTPLHSISGFTELLEKETTNHRQKKLLNGISQSNLYLNQLINNILEQAKINAGTYQLSPSHVYIPDLCNELEVLFKHRQEEKHIEFKISYHDTLTDVQLSVDSIKLKQVLLNLLSNAFKFTQQGSIFLQFQLTDKKLLLIKIADTGTGIDPKDHEVIFQPFNQIDTQHVSQINGSGLGLSITKHIVESFGGAISVTSEKNKGSIFTIHIPVKSVPYTGQIHTPPLLQDEKVFYPVHILAVEDDDWNACLLENYLSPYIRELKVYSNAEDGWNAFCLQPEHFHLVLTDLNLPQMDGKTFFRKIRSISGSIPVIAFSAGLSKKEADELIASGFTNTLGKPFSQQDLLSAIDTLFPKESITPGHVSGYAIEWSNIAAFSADGTEDIQHLCTRFTGSFESKVNHLESAILQKDVVEIARLSHQLKSNCEQIGILTLSERLQSVEVFAEINNFQRAKEEAEKILSELKDIISQLHSELQKM